MIINIFIKEYNITKSIHCLPDKYAKQLKLESIYTKFIFDHIEIYLNTDNKYVMISSPYRDKYVMISSPYRDKCRKHLELGFVKINSLYSKCSSTYIYTFN